MFSSMLNWIFQKSLRIICNKADEEKLAQHCFSLHSPPNIVIKAALTNTDTWKSPCHYNSWTNICQYILYTNLYYPAHSTKQSLHSIRWSQLQPRDLICPLITQLQIWQVFCGGDVTAHLKSGPHIKDLWLNIGNRLKLSQTVSWSLWSIHEITVQSDEHEKGTNLHNNTHKSSHTLVSASNWRNAFTGRWL